MNYLFILLILMPAIFFLIARRNANMSYFVFTKKYRSVITITIAITVIIYGLIQFDFDPFFLYIPCIILIIGIIYLITDIKNGVFKK